MPAMLSIAPPILAIISVLFSRALALARSIFRLAFVSTFNDDIVDFSLPDSSVNRDIALVTSLVAFVIAVFKSSSEFIFL